MSKTSKKLRKTMRKIRKELEAVGKNIPESDLFVFPDSPYYWQYITYRQLHGL